MSGSSFGWFAYAGGPPGVAVRNAPEQAVEQPAQWQDLRRLWRRAVRRTVQVARADEQETLGGRVVDFLGDLDESPVVSREWPAYDEVNVQTGLNVWLAQEGRRHETLGVVGFQHTELGLADLVHGSEAGWQVRLGRVATRNLPTGPGDSTLRCVQCAVHLVTEPDGTRLALLQRARDPRDSSTSLQLLCPRPEVAEATVARIGDLAVRHNVYRGQVLGFGRDVFGNQEGALLSFHQRPQVPREQVILPEEVLDQIHRQVVGVAQHRQALLAAGQHLRRGVLLYGPPGVGKTHTVRHLTSQLRSTTVLHIAGEGLDMIAEACSVARTLEPSLVVIEDVDLVAQDRSMRGGGHPLLFQLLNEMDGLAPEADVTFVLTTNRADLLEEALAARPGRIDQAVQLDLPDAAARAALIELYRAGLGWDVGPAELQEVIAGAEGVTASFLKELLRRSALVALERDGSGPPTVTGADLQAALRELLDSRNRMTRRALGAQHSVETAV